MRTFSNLHDAYHVVHCSHAFIYLFFYGKGVASPFKVLYLALKLIIDLKLIIISLNISIFCLWLFYTLCISHTHTLCIYVFLSLCLSLSQVSLTPNGLEMRILQPYDAPLRRNFLPAVKIEYSVSARQKAYRVQINRVQVRLSHTNS